MNNFHLLDGKVEFRWKRWRNKKRQEVSCCLMVLFSGMVLLGAGGVALAGPTGGQVTSGTGTISQTGATTNINQTSDLLSINWQDFSIGANETVNFLQPGSDSIAINRVVGGVPSYLAGALNANGRVFILNNAGITFTGTSQVNVGALLATTAMTINGDPSQAASYSGSGYGSVVNQGTISISNGGFAILAAPYVQNTGFIKADLGTIALAGTNEFTLDLSGTGLINFTVPAGALEKIVSDGKAVGVDNSGTLQARSGQVIISANLASEVVNAVVNLNGVVDADAFAPNGAGGSVLVSAAGDVNVGGQVTARGDGAGAGGQIVTKAGEDDAIGAMAFVSAAGGDAGGQGGFIEVSGKHLMLAGNIDPGSGGSLLIDPANMRVTPFSGASNQSAATVNEHFVELQLQANHNVILQASHDITFSGGTGGNFTLHGGRGNLTVVAGTGASDDIAFRANNYTIRTGSGQVSLTAGGDIGSSTNRLSVVSGVGADLPLVTQAGDIKLTTLHGDIFVRSITARASGDGQFGALFSANAGHSFDASRPIDVEAHANGTATQTADAEIHINAADHIQLHGVTDIAGATQPGGGGGASAEATITLNGAHVADSGNLIVAAQATGSSGFNFNAIAGLEIDNASDIDVTGVVDVSAKANVFSASSALASARAEFSNDGEIDLGSADIVASVQADKVGFIAARASLDAEGSDISIAHDVVVEASANNANLGRSASASANLFLAASESDVAVLGNVSVTALALNGGGSKDADAFAELDIAAQGAVDVGGDVIVTANAQTLHLASSDSSTPNASAIANFSGLSGVHLQGDLDVEAVASSLNTDSVTAKARANLNAFSGSIEIDGSTKVAADGRTNAHTFFSTARGASASASLLIHSEGHVDLGAVTVAANAEDLGSFQARAVAKASILSNTGSIDIRGDVDVEADAEDGAGNSAYANAQFVASANAGVHVGFAGSAEIPAIEGDVAVTALADAGGSGNASAVAGLSMNGGGDQVVILGDVALTASAHDAGGGNALASAIGHLAGSGATDLPGVEIGASSFDGAIAGGDVRVTANAVEEDGAAALANAHLTLDPPAGASSIHVWGGIEVAADASNLGTASGQIAASASAGLVFSAAGHVEVDGNLSVLGHATNDGLGQVRTDGDLSFGSASSIDLAGVTIDVKALNLGDGSGGAKARDTFDATSGIVLHIDSLNLQAQASSHGGGNAIATASADITQDSVSISGDVTVNAVAISQGEAGNAQARANLFLLATSGSITVGGHVDVNASAEDLHPGPGNAQANAIASLDASSSEAAIQIGSAHVTANALSEGPGAAKALAEFTLDPASIHISGDLAVTANALGTSGKVGGIAASANAQLIFADAGRIEVDGAMSVTAHATNFGLGQVKADGDLSFGSASSIDLADVTIDVKALNLGDGSGGAKARDTFGATSGISLHIDSLNLQAQASSHGGGNATATASADVTQDAISIAGDVTLNAVAFTVGSDGDAKARAKLQLIASTGSLFIGGNVQINADAEGGTSSGNVFAIASLSAFAERDAEYDGSILVHANADDHGSGAAFAWALADLRAQSGSVIVDGNIDIAATLQGNGLEFGTSFVSSLGHFANVGFASADLEIEADDGSASLNGVSVTANANLTNPGQARSIGESSSGGARAEMNITANFGDIRLRGPVSVDARARALASSLFLLASANGAIHADEGDIALLDALSFRADAQASGTEDASAEAISDVELGASGDITLPGATSRAKAVASSADFGDASAFAILSLNAGHDVDITGSGAFAGASANAPFAFDRSVTASANLQIVAGHNASIEGDVVAAAVALGGGTDNIANAIVDIEAGSGGSGDVAMSGDLAALAFADPADDHALASIAVNAHNDIVIVGHDPIASAHAGTALAFLQTHVTDSRTESGGNGSSAIARITITAGGTVSFIAPPENEINDQVLALLALPTDTPDIDPDVLTEIQLLIDGQDCGVLGSAGADPAKGAGCSKSALTIAEPDALP